MSPEDQAQQRAGLTTDSPDPSSIEGVSTSAPDAGLNETTEPSLDDRIQAEREQRAIKPDENAGQAGTPGTSNEELRAVADAEAPEPARQEPPVVAACVDESDAAFVLKLFGVNPAKYMLRVKGEGHGDPVLDRSLLAHEVESYRHLFANRVHHGRFA